MHIISRITVTAAALLAATAAYASGSPGSPTVAANASATVVQPVYIGQTTALSFGTFSADSLSSGTIDSSGNVTGGVSKVSAGNPATFAVTGLSGASYTIAGDPTVTLTDTVSGSSSPMTATLTYPSSPRTLTGGSDNFNVTGVLAVAAGQQADPYSGTYNVSVHY